MPRLLRILAVLLAITLVFAFTAALRKDAGRGVDVIRAVGCRESKLLTVLPRAVPDSSPTPVGKPIVVVYPGHVPPTTLAPSLDLGELVLGPGRLAPHETEGIQQLGIQIVDEGAILGPGSILGQPGGPIAYDEPSTVVFDTTTHACGQERLYLCEDNDKEICTRSTAGRVGAAALQGVAANTEPMIAVVDGGVRAGHPLLAGRVYDRICLASDCSCPKTLPNVAGCTGVSPGTLKPSRGGVCGPNECLHGTQVAGVAAGGCASLGGTCGGTSGNTCFDEYDSCVPDSVPPAPAPALPVLYQPGAGEVDMSPGLAPKADVLDIQITPRIGGKPDATAVLLGLTGLSYRVTNDPVLQQRLASVVLPLHLEPASPIPLLYKTQQGCINAFPALGRVIEKLRRQQVTVVASTGNPKGVYPTVALEQGLPAPACLPGALAVGGIDYPQPKPKPATNPTDARHVRGYRSALVDMLAPSQLVWSSGSSGTPLACGRADGTSFAAPAVAGAIALARRAGHSPNDLIVKELCEAADPIRHGSISTYSPPDTCETRFSTSPWAGTYCSLDLRSFLLVPTVGCTP